MRRLLGLVLVLGLAAAGIWGFREGREEAALEAQREAPVAVPLRIVTDKGTQELRLSEGDEKAAGLTLETIIGSEIPSAAVIWSEGKPFVYLETAPLTFRKTEVTLAAFEDDHYEIEGLPLPGRLITRGAQLLLSEEERGAIKVGEENE